MERDAIDANGFFLKARDERCLRKFRFLIILITQKLINLFVEKCFILILGKKRNIFF